MPTTAVSPASANVKVGDFFNVSWGYDQTQINWFKVVGLTPKGLKVQEWSSKCVSDNGPQTSVVPGDSPATKPVWPKFTPEEHDSCHWCHDVPFGQPWRTCPDHGVQRVDAPVETKRLQSYDGGKSVYFHWTSFASASKWDGKPEYETGSGWGH